MKIVCLVFLGLVMTASQSHYRHGGTSDPTLCLPNCRGQVHGRRQLICPLPKGVRPPRELGSHLLFSGAAVILLNIRYNSNRDGFFLPLGLRSEKSTATTV